MSARNEFETRLNQQAKAIWLYGLSGAGKTTLANALEKKLFLAGFTCRVLDGDDLRKGLNRGLGFTDNDRAENIRRAAEATRLFLETGLIVICAFITPRRTLRNVAREIIGADDFIEVYLSAPFATCAMRDTKGLYVRANQGKVSQFTGLDSIFEPPLPGDPIISINSGTMTVENSLSQLEHMILPRLTRTSTSVRAP